MAWIALESFINSMLDDFSSLPPDIFELHERAFLVEKKLQFHNSGSEIGKFSIGQTEYRRLEDKIFFLIAKFSKNQTNIKRDPIWQDFQKFKETRNSIIHPRRDNEIELNIDSTQKCIETSKNIIKFVSFHVYKKDILF